jgi:hypothetical protein
MQHYKKKPHRGVNFRTNKYRPNKYRPKQLRASDPLMSERESQAYGLYSQKPFHIDDLVGESLMNWDDLRAIDLARDSRRHLERCWKLEKENDELKAENQRLRAELEMFKMQTQNSVPVVVQETKYRDAVAITPETNEKRKMADFFRRVRFFFILLGFFNQIIKHRCKFDNDDVEVEGCGSVLRKIFELVTCISTNISEKILKIPDLDFKFYGSKSEFEEFAKKVSEWICENKLTIPGTHFIIGKMRRFTAKKPMSNGSIAEYEKFMIEVIDSATRETFMIDIMNNDGTIVFPCDFTVNSLTVSQTRGIYSKDPLHRKGKMNFGDVILDIISKTTTCMTRSPWKFDEFSINFQVRQIKMREAGYEMQGAPILEIATCSVMCDDSICVSLTGCRCKTSKGDPIPLSISIYAAISISRQKHCPNCRDVLKDFVCSTVKPKQFMQEPKELPSKLEFECLDKRAEAMSQGYSISGLNLFSEESKDALKVLSDFSKRYANEEPDVPIRAGGGAAAQVPANQMRAVGRAAAQVPAHQMRAVGRAAAQVPALQNRAGGGAAAPVRRPQYQSDDDFLRIIMRGS